MESEWVYYSRIFMEDEKSEVVTSLEYPDGIDRSRFSKDDIRRQTKLFWYAFEGKKFAPNYDAYPNCEGVVGWINPSPDARDGDKVYIVLSRRELCEYSDCDCETGARDLYDGRANTLKLLKYGKKSGVRFPALEQICFWFDERVIQGEIFIPAREQLMRTYKNEDMINKALLNIGGRFFMGSKSSSEIDKARAWAVGWGGCFYGYKLNLSTFNFFLAY